MSPSLFTAQFCALIAVVFHSSIEQWKFLLCQGYQTPMGNMFANWILLKSVSGDQKGVPRFMFLDDLGEKWQLDGHKSSVQHVRAMIHKIVEEARHLIFDVLMFGIPKERFDVRVDDISDAPQINDVGYSFLTDYRNGFAASPGLLFKLLWCSPNAALREHFATVSPDGRIVWKAAACRQFLHVAQEALKLLLVSCHLTHGQPSRGTEFLSTTFVNLANLARSLRICDGQVVFALQINKTDSITGHTQVIPHFVCGALTELVVYYLRVVREVEQELAGVFCTPEAAEKYFTHLFTGPGGQWTSERFTSALQDLTLKYLGPGRKFGLASVRQFLIGIYYRHCNSPMRCEEFKDAEEQAMDELGAFMAGHSVGQAHKGYAVEMQTHGEIPEIKWRGLRKVSCSGFLSIVENVDPRCLVCRKRTCFVGSRTQLFA